MSEINYSTVVDGELFKFDTVGSVIEGILSSYKQQKDTGKGVGHVYEVKTKQGVAAFFAPSLLHKKLSGIQMQSIVKIVFKQVTKTGNGNTLKHFEVSHAPATEANLKMLGLNFLTEVEDEPNEADGGEIIDPTTGKPF